jgi:hypothetical protein
MSFRVFYRVVLVIGAAALFSADLARADERGISLLDGRIVSVGITLNPSGANLGFVAEIGGDDPRVQALVAVLRDAEPGCGHKCPNIGALRFRMSDESIVGIGLLPGHNEGDYGFRLYLGEEFLTVFCVDSETMLGALKDLGVPVE